MIPRFTVAIPAYNCAGYLKETLASVLSEDVPKNRMQILVVDDGSEDNPIEVIRELSPDRIHYYRQPNQGPCKTFNACLERAEGELIHILHGDDKVLPGFYAHVDAVFTDHVDVGMFTCRCLEIDQAGDRLNHSYQPPPLQSQKVTDYAGLIVPRNHIRTPGVVLRRKVYEDVGPYDTRLNHTQDWNMWLRASDWGPVWHDVNSLAANRIHGESDTSRKFSQGTYLWETRNAVHFWAETLPKWRGLKFKHIIDLAVVRLALQDLAAHNNNPYRRAQLEEQFRTEMTCLEPSFRAAVDRRFNHRESGSTPSIKRRVVIFGAGQAGRAAATKIGASKQILAFLDNNPALHGQMVLEYPVLEPGRILHLDYDEILLASMSHKEMYSQLRFLGVDMRDVIVAGHHD